MTSEHTVLVSQHCAERTMGNAQAAMPARFRGVPSVAYRLALVAAGEAVGASSLAGPEDFDVAAAHALLVAAGMDLVDRKGQVIRYGEGGFRGGDCFGGPKVIASGLAKADLLTNMVVEFPELQGVMGGHYLRLEGQPDELWMAVRDHYRPVGFDGDLPESEIGRLIDDGSVEANHAIRSAEIVSSFNVLEDLLPAIQSHEEWYDGSGGPDGLVGEEIPEFARLLSVADRFVTLAKGCGRDVNVPLKGLRAEMGSRLDPKMVESFVELYQMEEFS